MKALSVGERTLFLQLLALDLNTTQCAVMSIENTCFRINQLRKILSDQVWNSVDLKEENLGMLRDALGE